MKKGLIAAGVLLLLVVIVVASIRSGSGDGEKVYVEDVGRRDIEATVAASGQVDPKLKVNLSAHVIGKIEKLYFEEGDMVNKGERLVDLEKVNFVAQRDRMQSEVANRQIEVRRAEIALKNAEQALRRIEKLREQGISAEEVYDRARLDYENARANLAASREAVRQTSATLRQASEDLQRTTLVAPISGKVVSKSAQEGEVVVTGTMNNPGSVIAVIADLSEVMVEADVGETEIVDIKVGQPAKVVVDALSGETFEGSVVEIGSSATQRAGSQTGTRYFKVKVALANPDDRLRPGMTAQVDVVTSAMKDVIAVPVQSVVERATESNDDVAPQSSRDGARSKFVFVVEGGEARMKPVSTGISNATHVVIVSGLEGGEKIVTGPFRTLRRLKDGEKVDPVSEREERRSRADDDEEEDGDDG